MKHTFAVAALAILSLSGTTSAQETYEFSVSPVGGTRSGNTRFEINFNYLSSDSSIGSGGSELVFPLDVTQAGVQFGFRVMRGGHRVWTADLRLLLALTDPGSKMTDEDWDDTYGAKFIWSSTESRVNVSFSELEFEVARTLFTGRTAELAVTGGYNLQKIKQRMTNLSGWQRGFDGEGDIVVYRFSDDLLAGTYEIRYFRPQLGLAPRFLWGSVTVELRGMVSPLLYAKDIDDHVRRYFQIRTDGWGFGYGGRATFNFEPRSKAKIKKFFCLTGETFRAKIQTSGYREYYADNPDEGVLKGDRFAEEHTVNSTQYGINLAVGFRF